MIFDVIDFAFGVGFELNIPEIVFADFRVHPTEDLLCELLLEVRSSLNEGLKTPANGSREVITSADWINSEYKEVGIDPYVNTLIDNPQDRAITSRNNDPDIGLSIINKFLDLLELVKFLLWIE